VTSTIEISADFVCVKKMAEKKRFKSKNLLKKVKLNYLEVKKYAKKLLKVNDLPLRQSFIKNLLRKSLLKTLKKASKVTYLKTALKSLV